MVAVWSNGIAFMTEQSKALVAACFLLTTHFAYALTLKMEAVCSSETSVNFYWATQHYIPVDSTFH
jgi:hypothetical protein